MNSKLTVRPEISALVDDNGEMKHNEREMANICNSYFHSAFNRPLTGEELHHMDGVCGISVQNIEITPAMVTKKLEKLNKFKRVSYSLECSTEHDFPGIIENR